jgi:hypothetical protein
MVCFSYRCRFSQFFFHSFKFKACFFLLLLSFTVCNKHLFVLADFVDLIGTYSMSLIRAMVTCCIPMHEFGKIYAVLTAFENLIPIGVSQAYAEIWKVNFFCIY